MTIFVYFIFTCGDSYLGIVVYGRFKETVLINNDGPRICERPMYRLGGDINFIDDYLIILMVKHIVFTFVERRNETI